MASRLNYYQSIGVSLTPIFSCLLSLAYSLSFCLAQQLGEERSEKISEKQPSRHLWSVQEDRRYCSFLAAQEGPIMQQAVPLQPIRHHQSRYPHCSLRKSPCWSRWVWPEGNCYLWRAPAGENYGLKLQPTERYPQWSTSLVGTAVGDPCWSCLFLKDGSHGALLKKLPPVGHSSQFGKSCNSWEGPYSGMGEEKEQ